MMLVLSLGVPISMVVPCARPTSRAASAGSRCARASRRTACSEVSTDRARRCLDYKLLRILTTYSAQASGAG